MIANNFDLRRQILGLHAKDGDMDTEEPVTEFKAKLNKYGFLHVPKKAVPSLPFEPEKPLIARIEGETLVIASSPEKINLKRLDQGRRKPKVINIEGDTVAPFFSFWRTLPN